MSDSSQWPINPRTKQPLSPRPQPGYYPGFSTLGQKSFWDDATRKVVLDRVESPPPLTFFNAEEAALLTAVCDRILPQDDRDAAHRIPVINGIDKRLAEGRTDGYRYAEMPPDPDAYKLGLKAIDAAALARFGKDFQTLGSLDQDTILKSLHDGKPDGGEDIWERMPVHRFWMLLVQDVVEQYYAHPYAWDEIGFGGPAYPRAYVRLENGQPEPWEVEEQRYEWDAPPTSLSGKIEPLGESGQGQTATGQGGTH